MSRERSGRGGKGGDDEESTVDPKIISAIEKVIQKELKPITARLDEIDKTLRSFSDLKTKVDSIESAMQNSSDMLDTLVSDTLPSVFTHLSNVAGSLAHQTLKIDVHRRKWNLTIHGVKGAAGEKEHLTRDTMVDFAKNTLKVKDPVKSDFAACHRLSGAANAGVIVRFCDLSKRDKWLSGTKHLKGMKNISVSPDLPPVLRQMKDELMKVRRELDGEKKMKAKVRYLPAWPFVELKVGDDDPIRPKTTLASVTQQILGFDPSPDPNLIGDLSKFTVAPKGKG